MALDWSAIDDVIDELRDLGVSADLDPSRVNVPGAWFQVVGFHRGHLDGHYTFTVRVYLIGPDVDTLDARRHLGDLVDLVDPVLSNYGSPTGAAELVTVAMPSGAQLPAVMVPVDIETE